MSQELISFTVRYEHRVNTLITSVMISEAFYPNEPAQNHKQFKQYKALWDTGATGSVITERVIQECGLAPIGVAKVKHGGGTQSTDVYLVNIILPNKVLFHTLRATRLEVYGADMLIGMDVISRGDFAVTHKSGRTVFSFRFPSAEDIDFVKEVDHSPHLQLVRGAPRVGRNDLCPCGSKKKSKYCCHR